MRKKFIKEMKKKNVSTFCLRICAPAWDTHWWKSFGRSDPYSIKGFIAILKHSIWKKQSYITSSFQKIVYNYGEKNTYLHNKCIIFDTKKTSDIEMLYVYITCIYVCNINIVFTTKHFISLQPLLNNDVHFR